MNQQYVQVQKSDKAPYEAPKVQQLGSVQEMTQGQSRGSIIPAECFRNAD